MRFLHSTFRFSLTNYLLPFLLIIFVVCYWYSDSKMVWACMDGSHAPCGMTAQCYDHSIPGWDINKWAYCTDVPYAGQQSCQTTDCTWCTGCVDAPPPPPPPPPHAAWFATYGAGVISGSADAQSIKTTQPYYAPGQIFKNALVQPGVISPNPAMPSFAYGGLITRGGFDVKQTNAGGTTSPTDQDAFAKNIGVLAETLPDYQRFVDAAVVPSCDHNKLLTSCNLDPGIYKASLTDINTSLDDLNGQKYHIGPNTGGLLVLVQEDPGATGTLTIKHNVQRVPSAGYKRLVLVTNTKISIESTVGNTGSSTPAQYIAQDPDIQAMLITTFNGDPAIEVAAGAKIVKLEGPILAKGKVRFRRDVVSNYPGVLVQFNPFYLTGLAKLDASLEIFGSSAARWIYDY